MMTRVVVMDGHQLMREMLCSLLRNDGNFDVVGEAGGGLDGCKLCKRLNPRLVMLDLLLPELSGAEVIHRIRQQVTDTRILAYANTTDRQVLAQGLAARPHGMILGLDSLDTLKEAVRVVAAGGSYFTPFVCRMMNDDFCGPSLVPLTRREREILQLVAESCSSKEIAARLELAIKTVENHRQRLMEKLKLRDVAALTRYAGRHGLIDLSR